MKTACSISLETLLDFTEGRLDDTQRGALEAHLATRCAACQETLQWLGNAIPALAPLPGPSPEALAFSNGLVRLLPKPESVSTGRVPLIARLISGGGTPALAGARGHHSSSIQRLYETDDYLITLWDEADGGATRYLIGQVYARQGESVAPQEVVLLPREGESQVAEQEGSEFHAAGVPPGTYLLHCALETADLYVPEVEVGG